MPLTTIGSYLVVAQEIIAHWTQVNAALGANPLLLRGGYTLANFTTDRTALQSAIVALEPVENALQVAVSDRDIKKAALKPRITLFRNAVQHFLQGTPYEKALPTLPSLNAVESRFLKPFDDMANLWTTVNNLGTAIPGFTPPLLLVGGYALAAFNTDVNDLRTAYRAVTNTGKNARIARERRNVLLPNLKARMLQYRKAVLALFAPTDPLVQSLPAISPPAGSTPDPVTVSGVWNPVLQKAVLTLASSTDPKLDHYSVRTAPPPTYRAQDETTVGRIEKDGTTFETAVGLAASGSVALFRIYVVLTTDNERGSTTVKITRP